MHAPSLLLVAALLTTAPARPERAPRPAENLLAGPARCVLRYLDAVRLAEARAAPPPRGKPGAFDERSYASAKRHIAPRTLAEIERRADRGEAPHPLAPWWGAVRQRALQSFQLLAARRAPRGAAIVTVKELFSVGRGEAALELAVSEYLVARVGGDWKVVDRRPGATFDDRTLPGVDAEPLDEPPPAERAPRAPAP